MGSTRADRSATGAGKSKPRRSRTSSEEVQASPSATSTPPTPTYAATNGRKRVVVGISGASGAAYATRLVEQLMLLGHEVHLVATEYGRQLLHDELNITRLDLAELCPSLKQDVPAAELKQMQSRFFVHPHKDVGAVIASGSFHHDGMVVIPCSSTALGYIATGSGSNLLARAAMVTLKERRTLVLVHRESPLSLIDIENMRQVTLAGGIVAPANPGFYLLPRSIDEIVDFVVGKCLDLLKIEHRLKVRWADRKAEIKRGRGGGSDSTGG
ncbi:MAG: UbiX family flavin prenyltransferase [Phycisphaerales bacterium]|nr:UbiX family flavin prenyltransferase [Phycisphaerales bacterium]